MTAHSHITPSDKEDDGLAGAMAQLVETAYGLQVREVRPLQVAQWNVHYRLSTDRGVRCLKRYRHGEQAASLAYEEALYAYLAERGPRTCIIPERARDGRHIVMDGKLAVALLPWVTSIGRTVMTEAILRSGAEALADVHRALQPYRPLASRPSLDLHFIGVEACEARASQHIARLRRFMQRGLSGFCQQQLPQLDAVDAGLQDNLCQRRAEYARLRDAWGGVVHGEFRPANLSIVGDAVIGILDWNRSFVETRLHDICFAAVAFSGPEELSRWHCAAQFQQFLAYYDACFPLQEEEWRLLPGYLEYMALRSTLASWRVEQFVERYAFLECLPNLIPSAVHAIGIGPEGIES